MEKIIIGLLVIVVPMVAYCIGTVKRDELFAEEAGGNHGPAEGGKRIPVTKDTKMGQILAMDKGMGDFLMQKGLHCVTCASAAGESLEMACAVHDLNLDNVLTSINEYLSYDEEA